MPSLEEGVSPISSFHKQQSIFPLATIKFKKQGSDVSKRLAEQIDVTLMVLSSSVASVNTVGIPSGAWSKEFSEGPNKQDILSKKCAFAGHT